MHEFASLEEAAATLGSLVARAPEPLAVKLPRRAGFKEQRYAHLLSGEVPLPAPEPAAADESAVKAARLENEQLARLEAEAAMLRSEVAELRKELDDLRRQLG